MLRELYPPLEREGRRAAVIDCVADKKIDLVAVKQAIRRAVPMAFFHVRAPAAERDLLLGLNAVHIPEREDIAAERAVVRAFEDEPERTAYLGPRLSAGPRSEVSLAIEACRFAPDVGLVERCLEGIEADYLERKLARGMIAPYFASRLADLGLLDRLPAPLPARLREALAHNLAIHETRARTLEGWLAVLERRGLSPVLIKGDAIARVAYARLGHKLFWDHDVLVPVEARREAVRVCVEELGLVPMDRNGVRTSRQELLDKVELYHNVHLGPPPDPSAHRFGIADDQVKLEIHWEVAEPFHPYRLPPELFLAGARRRGTLLLPRDEVLFLHLVVHQFKHACHESRWGVELRLAVDLYRLVLLRSDDWEWDFVEAAVRDLGLAAPFAYVLRRDAALFPELLGVGPLASLLDRFEARGRAELCPVHAGALAYNGTVHDHSVK